MERNIQILIRKGDHIQREAFISSIEIDDFDENHLAVLFKLGELDSDECIYVWQTYTPENKEEQNELTSLGKKRWQFSQKWHNGTGNSK